jgi:hypothetical protein
MFTPYYEVGRIQPWFGIPLSSNFPNPINKTIVSDVSLECKMKTKFH